MTAAVARPPLSRPRRRLNGALVASLLAHALLLSLSFGDGLGLPGLALPWQDRRTEVPALRVVLTPQPSAEPAAAELLSPAMRASLGDAAEPLPVDAPANALASAAADAPAEAQTLDLPEPLAELTPPPSGLARLAVDKPAAWAVPAASAVPAAVVAALPAASAPTVESLRQASDLLRPRSDTRPNERASALAQLDSPDAPALPAAAIAALSGASGPGLERLRRAGDALRASDSRERAAELAQLDSARQDTQQRAQRLEAARQDALRQEAARAEAARLEAERQEAARLAAARQEAARLEVARQEARQEAQRQAAARDEATRQETARQEAARADAARQEAARLEAARQEGLRKEAARVAAVQAQAQAEAEQREARLRAIGRQLDEEAAKRDAARQRPDWTPARRGRLFGRTDSNAELVLYAEAWARKIQLNPTLEMAREAAQQPYIDPIVTVAVRSDGSVESITLVRSSGLPALDEAVRRIVLSQERYPAFQPALLRDYDVVEIRRSWHFDSAVRLY